MPPKNSGQYGQRPQQNINSTGRFDPNTRPHETIAAAKIRGRQAFQGKEKRPRLTVLERAFYNRYKELSEKPQTKGVA